MMNNLADCLGKPVSRMLHASPFKDWPVERSFENDLEERLILYVFPRHGLELRCDPAGRIEVIFLTDAGDNGFDKSLFGIPFSWRRDQVLEYFGKPSRSGDRINDPVLGEYGAWDRFTLPDHIVHVEYRLDSDSLKRIAIFQEGTAPG